MLFYVQIYFKRNLNNSNAGGIFSLHIAHLSFIPRILYGPPSTARNAFEYRARSNVSALLDMAPQTKKFIY